MSDDGFVEVGAEFGVTLRWTEEPATEWEKDNTTFLGATFEGCYKERREGVGAKDATVHVFESKEDNSEVNVFGCTVLDRKLEKVTFGSEVKLEYLGMGKSQDGNEFKNFKVLARQAPMAEV